MKAETYRCSNATVSRALWAGALYYPAENEEVARNYTDIDRAASPVSAASPDNTFL